VDYSLCLVTVRTKVLQNGRFVGFSEPTQIVGAGLAGASVTKKATVLGVSRAEFSKVMTAYTNHGKTPSTRGMVAENQSQVKGIAMIEENCV
jgi:hypothetical protein